MSDPRISLEEEAAAAALAIGDLKTAAACQAAADAYRAAAAEAPADPEPATKPKRKGAGSAEDAV